VTYKAMLGAVFAAIAFAFRASFTVVLVLFAVGAEMVWIVQR
jgi:hypothetical protein